MTFHDVSDQLDHVRSIFGLLRVTYSQRRWGEAHNWSIEVISLMEKYQAFDRQSYYIRLSLLFQAIILCQLERCQEGRESFDRATYYSATAQHYITGLGTYVLKSLQSAMQVFSFDD